MNPINEVVTLVGPANNWLLSYRVSLANNTQEQEEKDIIMFRPDTSIEITQRNFILQTLTDTWYNDTTLRKEFYLEDDYPPRTAKDLVDRINKGMYVLPERKDQEWDCPLELIRWRDPAKEEDKAGYLKAREQRKVDFDAAKSTIVLKDIVAGQAALEEFKAKKYN